MAKKENVEVNNELPVMDAKGLIAEHSEKRTKIKYQERMDIEIIKPMRFYKVGQKVSPHKIMAQKLIDDGFAKKVTK
jgi:hypothetical protein